MTPVALQAAQWSAAGRTAAATAGASGGCIRRASGAAGFTLVELLIALVLIAVIMVLMFSGLRLGSRAWEGVATVSERVSDLRVARNFIERTLRQARPIEVVFDGAQWPVFAGEPTRLELVAPLSEHVGIPGLYILRLGLEPGGEYDRLVLVRWLLHPEVLEGGDDYPAWEPLMEDTGIGSDAGPQDWDVAAGAYGRTVLLPEVAAFGLVYFGVAEGETEPEWFDEWADQPRLPQKVRLALRTPRQTWPDVVVELPGGAALVSNGAAPSDAALPASRGGAAPIPTEQSVDR
jgi:general secretion pathway protein J